MEIEVFFVFKDYVTVYLTLNIIVNFVTHSKITQLRSFKS